MPRVLIVSPLFVPTNAADMHRVRQMLPFLREFGWEATVLAVDPRWCEQPTDDLLSETIPKDVRIHRVDAIDQRLTRRFGVGDLALRAYRSMRSAGAAVLASQRFDLIFFSTTTFGLIPLGREWRRAFGTPFVVDLQDPWLSDYYSRARAIKPPGGRLKYWLSQRRALSQEATVMREVEHVVTVSPSYPKMLAHRYDRLTADRCTVLPFGAAEIDFEVLGRSSVRQTIFDPADGNQHWVYGGRAGGDMALALRAFFLALARAREQRPSRYATVRLHFVGTSYATGDRAIESIAPLAREVGVGDLVDEHPRRIPYFETLKCLAQADALVVPGSDDPGYTASKLYPYILSRKPLLGIFHERSSVPSILRSCQAGTVVTFRSDTSAPALSQEIAAAWFDRDCLPQASTDWDAFQPYTAREMTRRLCSVFERAARGRAS